MRVLASRCFVFALILLGWANFAAAEDWLVESAPIPGSQPTFWEQTTSAMQSGASQLWKGLTWWAQPAAPARPPRPRVTTGAGRTYDWRSARGESPSSGSLWPWSGESQPSRRSVRSASDWIGQERPW